MVAEIRLYREGLAQSLSHVQNVQVVGTATGGDAIDRVLSLGPDVAVLDVAMRDGMAAVRALRELAPTVGIVAVAMSEVEQDFLAYAELGVTGYLPRDASLEDLIAAVECMARGETPPFPTRMTGALLRRVAAGGSIADEARLTVRQLQVIELIDSGRSNKEIAQRLGIEVATVKNHVHNLLEKLQVHHRGEAAACVRRTVMWRRRITRDQALP